MSKHLSSVELSPTLTLSTCTDGLWLYDKTRGMNLSMRAKDERTAFVEALTYYQNRLRKVEQTYATLKKQVDAFVEQVSEDSDD